MSLTKIISSLVYVFVFLALANMAQVQPSLITQQGSLVADSASVRRTVIGNINVEYMRGNQLYRNGWYTIQFERFKSPKNDGAPLRILSLDNDGWLKVSAANSLDSRYTLSTTFMDSLNAVKSRMPAPQVNADWNASSGAANILNKPTLGTAASANSSDFATASQGLLAASALQPNGNGSGLIGLTKSQVGLSNVDNTSDANKPVSTATQTALDAKQNAFAGTTGQYVRGDGSLASFPSIPAQNVYNAGFGISKSGAEPSASFAINTSDIMTVNRATDSIASINNKVNGKASAATTVTINGVTQDLSANRTWNVTTITGNAGTATALQTARNINGVPFNGTADITIPTNFTMTYGTATSTNGSAVTINTQRGKIALAGTGSVLNILANGSLTVTLNNSLITSTSTIVPNINGAGSGITIGLNCIVQSQAAGTCTIQVLNLSLLSVLNVNGRTIDFVIFN